MADARAMDCPFFVRNLAPVKMTKSISPSIPAEKNLNLITENMHNLVAIVVIDVIACTCTFNKIIIF